MVKTRFPLTLGLIGASSCGEEERRAAYETGREIASAGALLICGGGGGVMLAGCEGAKSAGGTTIGILSGRAPASAAPNPHIDIPIYTDMGQARNQIIVLSSAAVVAVGGEWGTLSEIALARKHGIPVVLLDSWELRSSSADLAADLPSASDPKSAVRQALELAVRP